MKSEEFGTYYTVIPVYTFPLKCCGHPESHDVFRLGSAELKALHQDQEGQRKPRDIDRARSIEPNAQRPFPRASVEESGSISI